VLHECSCLSKYCADFFGEPTIKKKRHLMSLEYIVGHRSDCRLTGDDLASDKNSSMLGPDLIIERGSPIDTLLRHFFSAGENASQSMIIINKLSGKALEVENSSADLGARVQQFTLNGASNQRWSVKGTKFLKYRAVPGVIGRQALRLWPTFLRFPQAGYSLIADHSGLCLDVQNGLTVVQQPSKLGHNQLWGFVPDHKGFNFIVNLHSGHVLDVAAIKNCAPVRQYPFNGGDSQRWQLIK
jgi:hypothetical protein